MKGLKLVFVAVVGLAMVFGAPKSATEKVSRAFQPRVEPMTGFMNSGDNAAGPIHMPTVRNGATMALVDSSKNGYGMIVGPTNPLEKTEEGWIAAYRQWAGAAGTSGQIGAAFSADGDGWETYTNLNPGMGIGRYPSAMSTPDYPYAMWNEYTGPIGTSLYGGRPYYAYDEFGWDGGSFSEAYDIDFLWDDYKDFWVLSPVHNYDADNDMHIINIAMDDWTRGDLWLFHSEAYDDGYIIFGDELMMINEGPDVIGGDEAGSYTSNGIVHINDDGVGYFAATAYFVGADQVPPSSQYSNTHTMIFKKTENFGLTWSGGQEGSPYYFIDDNVFDQMIADGLFPSIYVDECDGSEIIFDGLFLIYDFDLKVDSEGNPHFVAGVIMSGGDGVYPGMPGNAWVHFTIDKDYLLNPGTPNTATGWNYSILMPSHEMWRWDNADGESYWQGTFPSLQFSEENENVMWVVISGPDQGDFVVTDDGGTPEDDCDDLGLFPAWNEEVFILKSVDMGETWWCQYNMTQTIPDCWVDEFGDYQCEDSEICPDGETLIEPDEVNAHAGIGATDDTVPVIYQSPDWCFGSTTGDLSAQNHKTRIFVGTVELTTEDMTECEDEPTPCLLGDVNDDLDIDILDIVSILNNILQGTPLAQPCAADFNEDGAVDILDIVSIVNLILGNRSADATRANIFQTENGVEMTSDGYVGAVQMTLNHNSDFAIELTGDALIADYVTTGNTTTLVVVNPESKGIFTATGEFSIDSAVAANSAAYINVNVADSFALLSNYPNPFNPETVINYEIAVNGSVEIAVFNMVGQKIATLVNENREVGNYSTIWNGMDSNGREVASGVYIVQLKSQNEIVTNKITLLR